MNAPRAPLTRVLPLLLIGAVGCGGDVSDARTNPAQGSTANAIVGGSVDNGHDAVAMLYHQSGYICSGTMISDRVYLTAAHCIEGLGPSGFVLLGGTDLNFTEDWAVDVEEVEEHPDYDSNDLEHDVGIVVLEEDAPVEHYSWLRTDDEDVYDEGTDFTLVGYGVTGGTSDDSAVKRRVSLSIQQVDPDLIWYGSASENGCQGDSGGPALVNRNGKTTVIGVTSFGDPNCEQYGASMRTDDNADFIGDYVKSGGGGGGGGPLGCSVAGTSSPGAATGSLALVLVALAAFVRRR